MFALFKQPAKKTENKNSGGEENKNFSAEFIKSFIKTSWICACDVGEGVKEKSSQTGGGGVGETVASKSNVPQKSFTIDSIIS